MGQLAGRALIGREADSAPPTSEWWRDRMSCASQRSALVANAPSGRQACPEHIRHVCHGPPPRLSIRSPRQLGASEGVHIPSARGAHQETDERFHGLVQTPAPADRQRQPEDAQL